MSRSALYPSRMTGRRREFRTEDSSRAPTSRCACDPGLAENYPAGKFDMLGGGVVGGGWGGAMLGGATRAGGCPGPSGELAPAAGAVQPWDVQTPPDVSQQNLCWSTHSSRVKPPGGWFFMQLSYMPMSHSPLPPGPPPLLGSAAAMAGYPSVVVPSAMAAVNRAVRATLRRLVNLIVGSVSVMGRPCLRVTLDANSGSRVTSDLETCCRQGPEARAYQAPYHR
jgi:hypothetical protein